VPEEYFIDLSRRCGWDIGNGGMRQRPFCHSGFDKSKDIVALGLRALGDQAMSTGRSFQRRWKRQRPQRA